MNGIVNWITGIILAVSFGSRTLAVVLVSMVPLLELKGGIPVGVKLGLGLNQSFWFAFIGSSLVCIPLLLAFRPFFDWVKTKGGIGRIFARIELVFRRKAGSTAGLNEPNGGNPLKTVNTAESNPKAEKKPTPQWLIFWSVFVLTALPVPGTGVWTSSAVAVILGLEFWRAVAAIILGNLAAGGAILGLTALMGETHLDIFLSVLFILFVVLLAWFIYKVFTVNSETKGNRAGTGG